MYRFNGRTRTTITSTTTTPTTTKKQIQNINGFRYSFAENATFLIRSVIRWSLGSGCHEGEFVMSEPEAVAKLWGQQKGKPAMNYEKLSR
jgi:hypothetical protein